MFEDIRADLRRYVPSREHSGSALKYAAYFVPIVFFHEGAITMIGYRTGSWLTRKGLKTLSYMISKLTFFVTGNYIHHETRIAPGCKINHSSVVIHAESIGVFFECSANVTIGQKIPYQSRFPVIGDNVMIGAGARVLADLEDEVIVGANAVVIEVATRGSTVAGIPAKRVGDTEKYMKYYKSFKHEGH